MRIEKETDLLPGNQPALINGRGKSNCNGPIERERERERHATTMVTCCTRYGQEAIDSSHNMSEDQHHQHHRNTCVHCEQVFNCGIAEECVYSTRHLGTETGGKWAMIVVPTTIVVRRPSTLCQVPGKDINVLYVRAEGIF